MLKFEKLKQIKNMFSKSAVYKLNNIKFDKSLFVKNVSTKCVVKEVFMKCIFEIM